MSARYRYSSVLLATLLLFACPVTLYGEGDARGYSLRDDWDQLWRTMLNRNAHPNPRGPLLQRFAGDQYPEYQFDLMTAAFSLSRQQRWVTSDRGVRLWVQSLDELELANRIQAKQRVGIGSSSYVGFQYNRYETRHLDSNLFGVEFGADDISDSGFSASMRFYPCWKKDDSDVELATRHQFDDIGSLGFRVFAFDPFTNASYAILEARDADISPYVEQLSLPLGTSLEFLSVEYNGLRAELFGGFVFEHRTELTFPDEPSKSFTLEKQARLAAGLVEWDIPSVPVDLGLVGKAIEAETTHRSVSTGQVRESTTETTQLVQTYLLSQPTPDLSTEAFIRFTERPETRWRAGTAETRSDREWVGSLRTHWRLHNVVGLELGLLWSHRKTNGAFDVGVDGTNARLLTRPSLQLGEDVWTAIGVGWDLDGGTSIYDGGGMTLIAQW